MLGEEWKAWQKGYASGKQGASLDSCPHSPHSAEAWAWRSGFIEGRRSKISGTPATVERSNNNNQK